MPSRQMTPPNPLRIARDRPFGFGMDADILRRALAARHLADAGHERASARLRRVVQRLYAAWLRRLLPRLERVLPARRVRCVICSWTGLEFRPLVGPGWMQRNARCPSCGSVQRQRLVALALEAHPIRGRHVLWVAPETCLSPLLRSGSYPAVTVDLVAKGVDIRADVEALPIGDHRLDAVVSSDVLEHVVDDHQAMLELRRVLRPDGLALLHVPVLWTETIEYGFADETEFGHRRGYGPDVLDRLEAAGFEVEPFLARRLPLEECRALGLLEWDVVFVARPKALRRPDYGRNAST